MLIPGATIVLNDDTTLFNKLLYGYYLVDLVSNC